MTADASSPWMTVAAAKRFDRLVRKEYSICRQNNPALMKRLRKLSDDELDRVELALLEAQAAINPTPAISDAIRRLTERQRFRDVRPAPKPSADHGGPVRASQAPFSAPPLA
jgi:hypothetical protein